MRSQVNPLQLNCRRASEIRKRHCDPLGSHWTYTGGTLDSHWRNLGVIPISIKDRFPNRQESPSLQHLHWDETAIRILIAA